MKKITIITTILLVCFTGFTQTPVSIGDTVKLNIGNTYRGNLQWQISNDHLNWSDIAGATNSSLNQVITQHPTYLRAKTIEGTCTPVYTNQVTVDSLINITPPNNYTDSAIITIYQDSSFANQEIGTVYTILYPGNGPKIVAFGSHNSAGEPDTLIKEAKVYSATGDTVVNIKYDSAQRITAVYFSVNGVNDSLLYNFSYNTFNDTVTINVFKVFWNNDSIALHNTIYTVKDADSLVYVGQVYFKNDQPTLPNGISGLTGFGIGLGAAMAVVCGAAIAAAPTTGGTSLLVCGVATFVTWLVNFGISNAGAATINTSNAAPSIYSPFAQSAEYTLNGGVVFDIDGNAYHTVKIGNQIWFKENLKTARFTDGSPISAIQDSTAWANIYNTSAIIPAWCYWGQNAGNNTIYGKLYNWYAVVDNRQLCPTGWHVPTDGEWEILVNYLGGSNVAGGSMKEVTLWQNPNTGATNSSGFTALPGGTRNQFGNFQGLGSGGDWWSSTSYNSSSAWYRYLSYSYSHSGKNYYSKAAGFSIRCLID